MNETIILSSINARELLRSLSLKGLKFFNIRVFNSLGLAKEALLRSGIVINKEEISTTKQECIIYNLLKDVDYFKDSNFMDAQNITKSINYARMLSRGNETIKIKEALSSGEFIEKNAALLEIYEKYKEYLAKNNLTDSIEIINQSIACSKAMPTDFVVFKETPIEPLEEELLKVVSNNIYQEVYIREYAGYKDKALNGITYGNAYGSVNEIEYVLGYIAKNKIKYEDTTLVLTDSSYINHLLSYKDTHGIPMSFATGYDLSLSNAYKVLTLLSRWNKGYNAVDVFKAIVYASEFDTEKFFSNVNLVDIEPRCKNEIISTIGNLRINVNKDDKLAKYKAIITDEKETMFYPIVENIANEINKGYSYLIKTYTRIYNSDLENKAISTICSYIDEFFEYVKDGTLEDVLNILNNKRINKELSNAGKIHITDLNGGLSCIRKHLFICGLNAKNFPGSPNEDYLLLDSDLNRFEEEKAKTSINKVNLNKKLLFDLLNNASTFDSNIHLSFSGYNLVDLKAENPSSILFEIYKKEHGSWSTTEEFEKEIGEQHKYFDENITSLKNIGSKYLLGVTTIPESIKEDELNKASISYTISPSIADKFFSCPKRFYLNYVLGVKEPDEDNPFNAMPSNYEGTLIHKCMEDYGKNPNWTKAEFMENAGVIFNNFLNKRIPIHDKGLASIKRSFLEMASTGFDQDPKHIVVCSEKYLGPYTDPDTGLSFGGIVDRIEKLQNGNHLIVDYKTYKDFKNEDDDIDSCFQVVLYAYLLEKCEKQKVEGCEYRYLRNERIVKCSYDSNMESLLHKKLKMIKDALDTGEFPYTSDPEKDCSYCKLSNICGKSNVVNTKEEEDGE